MLHCQRVSYQVNLSFFLLLVFHHNLYLFTLKQLKMNATNEKVVPVENKLVCNQKLMCVGVFCLHSISSYCYIHIQNILQKKLNFKGLSCNRCIALWAVQRVGEYVAQPLFICLSTLIWVNTYFMNSLIFNFLNFVLRASL